MKIGAPEGEQAPAPKVPKPVAPQVHVNLANNLDRAITAAPHLQNHPDLAYAAATSPGNVENAAQNIGGMHLLHTALRSAFQFGQDQVNQAHAAPLIPGQQKTATFLADVKPDKPAAVQPMPKSTGFLGDLENIGKDIGRDAEKTLAVARGGLQALDSGEVSSAALSYFHNQVTDAINKAKSGFTGQANLDPLGVREAVSNPVGYPELVLKDVIKAGASSGNSFEKQFQTGEWIYTHEGPAAAGRYWANLAAIYAVSYGLTHDPEVGGLATGESGAAAIKDAIDNSPELAAKLGRQMEEAGTGAEQVTKAQAGNTILNTFRAAADNVRTQMGLDTANGVASSDATAAEMTQMIKDQFASLTENNPEIQIGPEVQKWIDDQAAQTAQTIEDQIKMTNPFRAGMQATQLGEGVGGKVLSGVGSVFKVLNNLMDSKTLTAGGITAQNYIQTQYAHAYNASSKEDSIGQFLSSQIGLGKNSVLSGSTDFIVALVEPQFMIGRAGAVEKGAADSIATVDNLDRAFNRSPRYMNALRAMRGKSAGEIQRLFTDISPALAEQIASLGKDASIKDIHDAFKSIIEAGTYTDSMRIPRMGLYGQMKAAKLSDSKLAQFFTHTFTQLPTVIGEKGEMSAKKFLITDKNALPAIGNMLAACGVGPAGIKQTLDGLNALLAKGDIVGYSAQARTIFRNALRQSLRDTWDKEMGKAIKKGLPSLKEFDNLEQKVADDTLTDEERAQAHEALDELQRRFDPFEDTYAKLNTAIDEYVDRLVRWDGPGLAQQWGGAPTAVDVSKVIDSETGNEVGAAILFNERGDLHFVNYQEMAKEFRQLLGGLDPANPGEEIPGVRNIVGPSKAANALRAQAFFNFSDGANKWINDKFFKPLALLTPGWALRVSASEAALNTARLGPVTMVAGFSAADLRKQIDKATRLADRKMAARGLGKASASDIEQELFAALDRDATRKIADDATLNASEKKALTAPSRARQMMTTDGVGKILKDRGYGGVPTNVCRDIALFVRGMMAGMDKNILRVIGHEELIKSATFLAFQHDSWLPGTVDSRHAYIDETVDVADHTDVTKQSRFNFKMKTKIKRVSFSDEYTGIEFGKTGFYEAWRQNALRYAADDELGHPLAEAYLALWDEGLRGQELHDEAVRAGRRILDNIPESERESMERSKSLMEPRQLIAQHDNPLDSWSEAAVVRLEGVVRGKGINDDYLNAYLHEGLLRAIARQDIPQTTAEFMGKYGRKTLKDGRKVPFKPDEVAREHVGRGIENVHGTDIIQKAATAGHEMALGKIVNWLSRQPVYVVEFHAARTELQDLVDRGILTADQADVQAQVLAAQHMIRYVHNPLDKTRFEESMRVVAPFYFAQNQAWRRMGRLFSSNPGAFMQYVAGMLAVTKWVSKTTAKNNISLFNIPMSAFMFGIPYTGSLSSLQTIDPFADPSESSADSTGTPQGMASILFGMFKPSFGPIVTVPAHLILESGWGTKFVNKIGEHLGDKQNLDNQLQNVTMGPIGAQTPLWESLVPNSVLRSVVQMGAYAAGLNAFGFDTALMQAQNQALAYLITEKSHAKLVESLKHESFADARWDLNQYQANLLNKNNLKSYDALVNESKHMALEMWMGKLLLTMGSPISIGVGEANPKGKALYQKYIKKYSTASNPYAGDDKFYMDHPDMIAAMIGNTSSVLGNYIPETKPVYEAIQNNPNAVERYPLAAWAYIGGISAKNTTYFQPAVTAEINAGLRQRNTPDDFIQSMSTALGNYWYYDLLKPIYNQSKKNGASSTALYNWEQSQINTYGDSYNPSWLNEFTSHASTQRANSAWVQLQQMMNDPQYKDSPITKGLEDFKQNYYPMLQGYLQQASQAYSGISYNDIKTWWTNTAIPTLLQNHPDLKAAAMSVLINLG